jgi:transketolase
MLQNNFKPAPTIFDEKPEAQPLRAGFSEGLLEAGKRDPNIVGLCADLTESTKMDAFRKAFPERFVQIGIAEQNLAATASGVAAIGYTPFMSSYAMFSPGRNWEQIRTTICYNDRPVKVVGSHAGVSVGPDGGTHQAIEDIALMRIIPRMVVVAPCDMHEAYKATLAIAGNGKPSYLRLAREKTPLMTTTDTPFEVGKAYEMWRSERPQVALMGYGPVLHNALVAAKELDEKGIGSVVLNVHTIKPLDEEKIVALAQECGTVVTIEEHQVAGGIGGAIAELLARTSPTRMAFVGVHDRFGQSGTPEELMEEYGMSVFHIVETVERLTK